MNTIEQPREMQPTGFSRRDFLKGAAALGVSRVLAPFETQARSVEDCVFPGLDSVAEAENPAIELQKKLFTDFEVIAVSPQTAFELTHFDVAAPTNPLTSEDPREWNYSNLSLAYSVINHLPKHITGSHEGEYLQIALENLVESACTCAGLSYTDNDPEKTHDQDVVWMGTHLFMPNRSAELDNLLMEFFTHETVGHRYIQDVRKHEPLQGIEDIFGKNLKAASKRVGQSLLKKDPNKLSPAELKGFNILNYAFSTTNAYGDELTDYRETGAYLSQLFLYGPETWENGLKPFVGARVTGALYDVLRDVFQKEYESFPQICPA